MAATTNGAAEEKSPGTVTSPRRSVRAGWIVTAWPRRLTRAPAAVRIRSVWSRVGVCSTTVVGPPALRPANRIADLICALATGSS